jgi:hypothetical protein
VRIPRYFHSLIQVLLCMNFNVTTDGDSTTSATRSSSEQRMLLPCSHRQSIASSPDGFVLALQWPGTVRPPEMHRLRPLLPVSVLALLPSTKTWILK